MSGDAGVRRAVASAGRRGRWHRCSCGRPIPGEVRRCSSRTCPEYAPTWSRDTRRRLFVNLEQLKLSVMFSVTAPRAGLTCTRSTLGSVRIRAAKVRADRATGFKGKLAARVWEKQKRGLAHLHGVISVESPAHVRWAEAYVTALRALAPRYGFASSTVDTRSVGGSGPACRRPPIYRATSRVAVAAR